MSKSCSTRLGPYILSALFSLTVWSPIFAAIQPKANSVKIEGVDCTLDFLAPLDLNSAVQMKRKEVEQQLGKKLKFKERVFLKLIKLKIRKAGGDMPAGLCYFMERKAKNGILFGLFGLIGTFLVVGIILGPMALANAVKVIRISKMEPDCPNAADAKRKGIIGIILGVVATLVSFNLIWQSF